MKINDIHFGASPLVFERAKELRLNMTLSESLMWEELKGRKLGGYKFRNQHPVSKYILDFYCAKRKLGIEIDGGIHEDKAQEFYDDDRTKNLEEYGIRVLRFSNIDVQNEIEKVKQQILEELQN